MILILYSVHKIMLQQYIEANFMVIKFIDKKYVTDFLILNE